MGRAGMIRRPRPVGTGPLGSISVPSEAAMVHARPSGELQTSYSRVSAVAARAPTAISVSPSDASPSKDSTFGWFRLDLPRDAVGQGRDHRLRFFFLGSPHRNGRPSRLRRTRPRRGAPPIAHFPSSSPRAEAAPGMARRRRRASVAEPGSALAARLRGPGVDRFRPVV